MTVDVFTKDLPASIQHSSVQAVREELRVVQERVNSKCGEYQKISSEDIARIGQYAAKNGGSAVLCRFMSTGTFPSPKESTIHGWKNAYCVKLLLGSRKRDTPAKAIKEFPKKRPGSLLLLGKEMEEWVKGLL